MTPEELDAALTRAYNEGRDEEWQRMMQEAELPVASIVNARLDRAGRIAIARYSAQRQRDMQATESMIEGGAVAASSPGDFRVDDVVPYDECDNLWRAEWRGEVSASFEAMQSVAPIWMDEPAATGSPGEPA